MKRLLLSFVALIFLASCKPVVLNTPVPVFETGVDPESWVRIISGEYLKGQFNEEHIIEYDYEMMVTDVTNAQYAVFLNEALSSNAVIKDGNLIVGPYPGDTFNGFRHEEEIPAGNYLYIDINDLALRLNFNGDAFSAKVGYENHPMTMVSWFGARAYCEYYGWRLPSEVEWEKAARGTDGRAFPWGDEITRNIANFTFSRDPFEDMSAYGSNTTPVGFYNGNSYSGYQTLNNASPYGLYDMAGNVWQWTGDVYPDQHYRYMRGGSKNLYENTLRVWVTNNATPTFTGPAVGFRCARSNQE
jgi:formylglycine-generating enzyme required for sulfatase activity